MGVMYRDGSASFVPMVMWHGMGSEEFLSRFGRSKTAPVLKILMILFDVVCCLQDSTRLYHSSISHRKYGRRCFNRPCGVGVASFWLKKLGTLGASGVSVSIPRFAWFVLSKCHPSRPDMQHWASTPARKIMTSRAGGPWLWDHWANHWQTFGNGKMMEDGSLHFI